MPPVRGLDLESVDRPPYHRLKGWALAQFRVTRVKLAPCFLQVVSKNLLSCDEPI